MTKYSLAACCALTLAAISSTSFAGTTISDGKDMKAPKPIEAVKQSFITGDLGVTFVSQYVSRGYVLENQGVIAQPYADLYFKLYSGEGFINNVSLNLGIWSSLHSRKTDQGAVTGTGTSTTPAWYEFDYTPGISVTFAKNFTLSLTYLEYNYPNDNFDTQRIIQTKLAYNDADLLGKFALSPYAKAEYYIENPDHVWYYEVGISPGFEVAKIKVNFPVVAGFGSDFYPTADGGDAVGYVSSGVALAYPLAFIPEGYGTWTLTAGYTYYWLNTATREAVGDIRDSNASEHVFSGGLGIAF